MKILITGSSGFVGGHLSKRLKDKHEIIPYDLKEGKDILDERMLNEHMKSVEVVVHLAALVSQPESWKKPREYFQTNVVGTHKVVETAIKNGVPRVIYTSSAAIYDPITPYGISKRWGEDINEVFKDQIKMIILRPFNIYGTGQNPAYGYAIHNFIRGINGEGKIEIFGNGKQRRDYIHIDDVVDTITYALTAEVPKEPIDVGTGHNVEILKLANIIGKLAERDFDIKFSPPRKEPFALKADVSGLRDWGINTENFHTLEEGLSKLLKE